MIVLVTFPTEKGEKCVPFGNPGDAVEYDGSAVFVNGQKIRMALNERGLTFYHQLLGELTNVSYHAVQSGGYAFLDVKQTYKSWLRTQAQTRAVHGEESEGASEMSEAPPMQSINVQGRDDAPFRADPDGALYSQLAGMEDEAPAETMDETEG